MQSATELATAYRSFGLQIVPSYIPGEVDDWKRPFGAWKPFQELWADDAIFANWCQGRWQTKPNLGLITGAISHGVFVVDIDTYKGDRASAWWSGLLALHNNAMNIETPTQQTGGGGIQMLFRAPAGWTPPTGRTDQGVDIRGEGGFAVMPPSQHSSGKAYAWLPGKAPDECEIATAPDWLCAAIDRLLAVQPILPVSAAANGHIRTASPITDLTPIGGLHVDGREEYMRDLVWAAVVGLRRQAPFVDQGTLEAERQKVWADYLAHAESRLAGLPDTLAARLEQEGRGLSLFNDKWRRAVAQWDGKVAEAARVADPHPDQQEWTPPPPPPPPPPEDDTASAEDDEFAAKPPPPPPPPLFSPHVWRDPKNIPQRRFLYGRHFIRQFLSVDISPGGVGKSSLSIADAVAMASHKPLLGILPTERVRVAYWNGEDPLEEIERKVAAVCLHYGVEQADLKGRLFLDSGRLLPLKLARQARDAVMIDHIIADRIVDSIRQQQIDVLIVDPFIASHSVNENDNNAIETVAKTWAKIADVTNSSIGLAHHSRKTNGQETTVEDARGASALLDASRSGRVLNQMSEDEAVARGIINRRLYFRVDDGKSTLQPPSDKATWYMLASVILPNGPMGTDGDNVGVVTKWEMPDPLEGYTAQDLRAVQNVVASDKWRLNPQARNWVGVAIAKALGLVLPDDKKRIQSMIAIWLKSEALVVVSGLDNKRMPRDFVEVGKWVEPDA